MRVSTKRPGRLLAPLSLLLRAIMLAGVVIVVGPLAGRVSSDVDAPAVAAEGPSVASAGTALTDSKTGVAERVKPVPDGQARAAEATANVMAQYRRGALDAASQLATAEEEAGVIFTPLQQATIELEAAAARWQLDSRLDSNQPLELRAVLERILSEQALHTKELLSSAVRMSRQLSDRAMSAGLYRALARAEPSRAHYWYEKCAQMLGAERDRGQAISCYERALASTDDAARAFELRQGLWIQRLRQGNSDALQRATEALLSHEPLSVNLAKSLVTLFQANERPAEAARAYARLVGMDGNDSGS